MGCLAISPPLPLFVKKWVILTEEFEMLIFDAYIWVSFCRAGKMAV